MSYLMKEALSERAKDRAKNLGGGSVVGALAGQLLGRMAANRKGDLSEEERKNTARVVTALGASLGLSAGGAYNAHIDKKRQDAGREHGKPGGTDAEYYASGKKILSKKASFADFARSGTRGAAIGATSGALLGAAGKAGHNIYKGKQWQQGTGTAALLGAGAGGSIGMSAGLRSHNKKKDAERKRRIDGIIAGAEDAIKNYDAQVAKTQSQRITKQAGRKVKGAAAGALLGAAGGAGLKAYNNKRLGKDWNDNLGGSALAGAAGGAATGAAGGAAMNAVGRAARERRVKDDTASMKAILDAARK